MVGSDIGLQHSHDRATQRRFRRALRGRSRDHDERLAAWFSDHHLRVRVDGIQRERRDDLFHTVVLPRDARHRFVREEVAPELVGQGAGIGCLLLRRGFGIPVQHVAFCRVELLGGETESPRALDLGGQQPGRFHRILPGNRRRRDERLISTHHR